MHPIRLATTWSHVLFLLLGLSFVAAVAHGQGGAAPQVQYVGGRLSIHASGCSVQQLLEAVQAQTKIDIEFPPTAAQVLISVDIAAGDVSTVLTKVLDETPFNYIMAGGGNTMRVILTEKPVGQVASAPPPPAPTAPGKSATIALPNSGKDVAQKIDEKGKKKDKKDEEDSETADATRDTPGVTESRDRPEIDAATLSKLPQLPPGIPVEMWRLYPEIVQNGGVVPPGPPTLAPGAPQLQPVAGPNGTTGGPGYYPDPPPPVKGVINLPTLPPGVDPNIGKLYPWNLMQTIFGPITHPYTNIELKLSPGIPLGGK